MQKGKHIYFLKEGQVALTHVFDEDHKQLLLDRGIIIPPYLEFDLSHLPDDVPGVENEEDPACDFFNCWQFDDPETPTKLILNLDKAIQQWTDHLRNMRDARLAYLDKMMVIALGEGNDEEVARIRSLKQDLRDMPSKIDFSGVKNALDLQEVYPAILFAE